MRPRLRLYTGDLQTDTYTRPTVGVPLGELMQILGEASQWNRAWVSDFSTEEVQVSADLYEVLSTYWHLRPSA